MNNSLKKEVMIRLKLKNKYSKNSTTENHLAYKKQRNLCVKLFRYHKRCFYEDLNINLIADNKKFWRTVKPSFTDKSKNSQNITLVEGKDIVTDTKKLMYLVIFFLML